MHWSKLFNICTIFMNEAYHIIKSLSSYFFINSHMSCKCITCKVGITDKETHKNINKSVRNIPNLKLINDDGANVYDLVKYKNVLFTTSSIKKVQERLLNEKN